MGIWEESDKKDWLQIQNDLNNPNSGLCLVLQDLIFLREKYIEKMKKARKEDVIFKYVGMIDGLDAAIRRPKEIVDLGKMALAEKEEGAIV